MMIKTDQQWLKITKTITYTIHFVCLCVFTASHSLTHSHPHIMAGCQMQTKWHERRKDAWRTTAFYKLKVLPFTFPLVLKLLAFVRFLVLLGRENCRNGLVLAFRFTAFFSSPFASSPAAIVLHYFLYLSIFLALPFLVDQEGKRQQVKKRAYTLWSHPFYCHFARWNINLLAPTENRKEVVDVQYMCVCTHYIYTNKHNWKRHKPTHTQERSKRKMGAGKLGWASTLSQANKEFPARVRGYVWWVKGKSKVIKPIFKLEKMLKLNNI